MTNQKPILKLALVGLSVENGNNFEISILKSNVTRFGPLKWN